MMPQQEEQAIVHTMNIGVANVSPVVVLALGVIIILLGTVSGYVLSQSSKSTMAGGMVTTTADGKKAVGSSDNKVFRDQAEGTIEAGGMSGEGTHKLIRPGGDSQTVYLTSSVVNLDEFVGKKVRVWGETFSAKKAAWFMDVGRVEFLE